VLDVKHVTKVCQLEVFVLLDSVCSCILLDEVQVLHHERLPHELVLAEHLWDPHFLTTRLLDILLMRVAVSVILKMMLRFEVVVNVFFE
jgi:hypothetical protein